MGHEMSTIGVRLKDQPPYVPESKCEPTFDPHFGFKIPRKKREMVATDAELEAFKMPKKKRDYCSHICMEYETCKLKNFPMAYNCVHILHQYHQCLHDDYIIRMKEYEREKRLRKRQMILEGKIQA